MLDSKEAAAISRGNSARDQRQWSAAIEHYSTAVELDPLNAPIIVQLGNCLKEARRFNEAVAAYKAAIELDQENADTFLQMGHAQKLLGDRKAAAVAYSRSYALDPSSPHAKAELRALGWSDARLRTFVNQTSNTARQSGERCSIAVELSDLIDFLCTKRHLTGIQRVQYGILKGLLDAPSDVEVISVYFDHTRFVEIEKVAIESLIDAIENEARSEPDRLQLMHALRAELQRSTTVVLPKGCILFNPGTSWGYPNYFIAVRQLQIQFGVRYVPYVHDCIPLLFPEYCDRELVIDYARWFASMLKHASFAIANSENTRKDVVRFARELGVSDFKIATVLLDYIHEVVEGQHLASDEDLAAHGIEPNKYVLFVSTIEPRKNHMLALSAWSNLTKSRKIQDVPQLICVGSAGWMNDDVYARVKRDELLARKVTFLTNIPESLLAGLYRNCLFTIFPSQYEGWGLPITEAIRHGKVPLVSDVSSHREAGGAAAVYFDLQSLADFQAKLLQLLDDRSYRASLEQDMSTKRPLRTWEQIARDLVTVLGDEGVSTSAVSGVQTLSLGLVHSFARKYISEFSAQILSAEALRKGMNWHAPEAWGVWAKARTVQLVFRIDPSEARHLSIWLRWQVPDGTGWSLLYTVTGGDRDWRRDLSSGGSGWTILRTEVPETGIITINLTATPTGPTSNRNGDERPLFVGLQELIACPSDDTQKRLDILEAIATGDFSGIRNVRTIGSE